MTDEDLPPSMDSEDAADADASDPAAQAQFQHRRTRLAAVFRQRYTSLFAYGRSLGSRNPADAEDSVQSTFLRVLAKRASLLDATDAEPHLKSVLLTGVKGRMRNHGRNGATATRSRAKLPPPPRSADFYPPDQIVEYQELLAHYQAALAQLSPFTARAVLAPRHERSCR